MAKKYEYVILSMPDHDPHVYSAAATTAAITELAESLNAMGSQGWSLAATFEAFGCDRFVLQRDVEPVVKPAAPIAKAAKAGKEAE